MKKTISLLLALVMCLSLCACGGSNSDTPDTPETTETTAPEEVKMSKDEMLDVAILHTAVSSGSWCGGQRQQCGDSGSGLR